MTQLSTFSSHLPTNVGANVYVLNATVVAAFDGVIVSVVDCWLVAATVRDKFILALQFKGHAFHIFHTCSATNDSLRKR